MASFDDGVRVESARWQRRRREAGPWLARLAHETPALRGAAAALAIVLAGAAFLRYGVTPDAAVAGSLICVLIGLSVVDIEQRRLPNRVVVPAAVAMLAVQSALHPERALEWLLAGLGAALLLLLPLLLYRGAMGMGDVKLAILLGSALGASVATALALAFIGGGLFALAIVARVGAGARRRTIPFGPFLAAGAIVTLFLA
jgi:leader peptidase (prepilin peptidase)/N-methyltransferase